MATGWKIEMYNKLTKRFFCILFLCGNVLLLSASTPYEAYIDSVVQVSMSSPILKRAPINVDKQTLLRTVNESSWFTVGDDNYFCTGIPFDRQINKNTADAKYQVSAQVRITKCVLPLNSYLALRYTQRSFWDMYKFSSPFRDNNYNPAVGVVTPVFKNNALLGVFNLFLEHDSNGRDSVFSRSQNLISASFRYYLNPKVSVQFKAWGAVLAVENDDLYDYRGFCSLALNLRNKTGRVMATFNANPNLNFRRWNITADLNFQVSKKLDQYVFVQIFEGYAESFLDYNKYTAMIRAGFCFKPHFISIQ